MNAKFLRNGIVMLVLVVGTVALLAAVLISPNPSAGTKPYSDFLSDVKAGKVHTVTQVDQTLTVDKGLPTQYTVIVPGLLNNVVADVSGAEQDLQVQDPASRNVAGANERS